ncbi:probable nucleolar protein 5-2 [Dendrobium catenatum]|uniref:probable nucleolar protein 5-2 n=1 Tax=Dendrobium catenatum TaxID=906689 RepID=UPI0010A0149F|nr:probable nucleolar protein 5-2 [Dendrobium catenatum]
MLVLFETPAGFALFKVLDEGKLSRAEDFWKDFESSESARQVVKLKAFSKFENTAEALTAATLLIDSKPSKGLRKFLRAHCEGETLGVGDSKLGNAIKEKLKIDCVHNNAVMELMRGLRSQLTELISGLGVQDLAPMSLGLSHSLSRYKLKFSPDKVDTMIIQAIGLLDELDKELNTYAMRVREWYGWHFPELAKIVQDNIQYAKAVKLMGNRANAVNLDFSEVLPEEVEAELKEAAVISMGTEVNDLDLANIRELCDQVLSLSEYRGQLYDYLRSRMNTIAPNLTALVGELVGARLIAHGGSLLNLAKQPGSTVQVLGAEKALFRALKTKHATPKYGLIFHASLVGQAAPKLKGKISRSLAAKAALAIRYDALADNQDNSMGLENRARLRRTGESNTQKPVNGQEEETHTKKRKHEVEPGPAEEVAEGAQDDNEASEKKKKKKKKKAEANNIEDAEVVEEPEKKKKRKTVVEDINEDGGAELAEEQKKKKKKKKSEAELENDDQKFQNGDEELRIKKKKKGRKHSEGDDYANEEAEEHGETEKSSKKKDKKKKKEKQRE